MDFEVCEDAVLINAIERKEIVKNKWNSKWLQDEVEVKGVPCKIGACIKKGKKLLFSAKFKTTFM